MAPMVVSGRARAHASLRASRHCGMQPRRRPGQTAGLPRGRPRDGGEVQVATSNTRLEGVTAPDGAWPLALPRPA
eukprot:6299578-Amphidinium_carterae.1